MNIPQRLRKGIFVLTLALAAIVGTANSAYATHFRYGTITWWVPNPAQPNVVRIRIETAWRRSFFGTPTVGQTVGLSTVFVTGDGSPSSSTLTPAFAYNPTITAINAAEDWMMTVQEVTYTFPAYTGNYLLKWDLCCRVSTLKEGNNDLNTHLEARVNVRYAPSVVNNAPVVSSLPILNVPFNVTTTIPLAVYDRDGDTVTIRPSTSAESSLVKPTPTGFNISPAGVITFKPTLLGLYAVQLMVEDGQGAKVPVDLLLNSYSPGASLPPVLRVNGVTGDAAFNIQFGTPLSFTVSAADPENQALYMLSGSLPPGANMTPSLPISLVNPASTFTWTPTNLQLGTYIIAFGATDGAGNQARTSVTINVSNATPTIQCTTTGDSFVSGGAEQFGILADVDDSDNASVTVRFLVDGIQQQANPGIAVPGTVNFTYTGPMYSGTHTYEARVTDGVSTPTSCTGTFTFTDTTAPAIVQPPDITRTAIDANGAVVTFALPAVSDLGDPAPSVACTPASGSLFPIGTTEVTCTATDRSGNAATTTFDVLIKDNTPPLVTPVVVGMTGSNGWYVSAPTVSFDVADDESGIASSTGCSPQVVPDTVGATFTCSATNGSGLTASASVTVAVDTVAPTNFGFTVLNALNVNGMVEATSPMGADVWYASSASDTTSGVANTVCTPATGSTFAIGETMVTCVSTDNAGNTGVDPFVVRVGDTTPPNIPPAPGQDFAVAEFTEATSPNGAVVLYQTPAWRDIADWSPVTVCLPASGSVFPIGQAVITCTSTDGHGNASVHDYMGSIVRDTTPPVITLNAASPFRVEGATPYIEAGATAMDIVDLDVTASIVIDASAVNTAALGTYPVVYTVVDSRGNSSSVTRTVSVEDATPPQMPELTGFTVEATSALGAVATYSVPPAIDTVAGQLPLTCVPFTGSVFPVGVNTITCSAIDPSGNDAQATFEITVADTTAPDVPPAPGEDFAVAPFTEATSPAGAVVTYQAPVWRDLVDPSASTVCVPASGSVFPVGQTTISCTSTDSSGNSAVRTYAGSVVRDTVAPTLTLPLNIEALGDSVAGKAVTFTTSSTDVVTATPSVVCTPASGSTFGYGTTTVSCTATDAAGNATSGSFTVTVKDNTPPVVTPTVTGTLGSNGWYTSDVNVSWTATDAESNVTSTGCGPAVVNVDGTASFTCSATSEGGTTSVDVEVNRDATAPALSTTAPEATEATSAAGAVVTFAAAIGSDLTSGLAGAPACAPASGSTFPLGTTIVSCTVADNAGNMVTSTFDVTVTDTTAPVLTLPSDIDVLGDNPSGRVVTFSVTAADLVTPNPGVACTPASGSMFAYGTTTVNCTATDAAGNATSSSFTVTVKDNTPPVVTATMTGTLGGNGWYTSDVNVSWTVADAESNVTSTGCGPVVVNTDGTASITCSATSEGGTTTVTQTVKRDVTAPVVTTSAPLTVSAVNAAGAPVSYTPASAVDPASGVNGTPVCVPASGSTFALGEATVTCTVADNAGNIGSASFTVTVRDTTAPVITATAPSTSSMWPPNHQMVPVTVSVQSTDNVTASPVCSITGVTSNEPQNGLGDGDTPNDWQFNGLSVQLRAERAGNGSGRTYTIAVQCADAAGNTTNSSTTVSVPKAMGKK